MKHRKSSRASGVALTGAVMAVMGAVALLAAIAGGGGGGALAQEGNPDKVTICHFDRNLQGPNAGPHSIEIDDSALDMHLENHVKAEGFVGDDFLIENEADLNECLGIAATAPATTPPTEVATSPATSVPPTNTSVPPTNTSVPTEEATEAATSVPTEVATTVPTEVPTEGPSLIITVAPTEAAIVSAAAPQATEIVGAPPQAPIDVEEEEDQPVSAVQGAAPPQQPVEALPVTGSGGSTGSGLSSLTLASLALLSAGAGLLLLSWRMRQA